MSFRSTLLTIVGLWLAAFSPPGAAQDASGCAALSTTQMDRVQILAAEDIPAGEFTTPAQASAPATTYTVPAFCRITAIIGAQAQTEVWLPRDNWTGRFMGLGNGGLVGSVMYANMVGILSAGMAVVSSDLGHQSTGDDASWALGRPDLLEDFGFRITHEMSVLGQALTAAYYGRPADFRYFAGTSAGGRQALMEAQRYPDDYDGIVVGTPANNMSKLFANALRISQKLLDPELQGYLTVGQTRLLNRAVLHACDALDGLEDGLIEDPKRCHYDPIQLLCKPPMREGYGCLTQAQVASARSFYEPLRDAEGAVILPGLERGSEFEWPVSYVPVEPYTGFMFTMSNSAYRNMVYGDPEWDFQSFDPAVDVPYADAQIAATLDAVSPDLDGFRAHGGKLLMWHGWADSLIPPQGSLDYRQSLAARYGESEVRAFTQFYFIPGVGHGSGTGPKYFDTLAPIIAWVEQGQVPGPLLGYHVTPKGKIDYTRPICPWPEVAQYQGRGSIRLARNYDCVTRSPQ